MAAVEQNAGRITQLKEQDEVELISVSSGPELTAIRQGNGKHPPQVGTALGWWSWLAVTLFPVHCC